MSRAVTDPKDELAALRIERAPMRPEGGRWAKWVVLLVVLAGSGFGIWRWMGRERPIEVEVAPVAQRAAGVQASVLNASGYVTARRRATVSSKVTGKVVQVNVEEGMAVREGQVLARLDDATTRAALGLSLAQLESARRVARESEVRLAEAKRTLQRRQQLINDGILTPAELDQAQAEVDSLDARIALQQEQVHVAERQVAVQRTELDNMIIRAPFSGVAISKDAQPGEMVSPISAGGGFTRTGICTIVDMNSLEIEVDVNESYINRVKPSQKVTAVLDAYPDWPIPAHVITTVPAADRQKATVLVRIAFEELGDQRILPDMGVKVTFLRDADESGVPAAQAVSLIPKSAVRTEHNKTYVFVVRQETVERRAVQTGGADGDRLEVVAGLAAGDRVVVSPAAELADGVKIVIKQ
ncbi:MAG: efflux RND transporter periplasmic adaptor subunit [Acidobacteria bacterium]|nr:efflux RND transporter periplasmic adaptor subunit [Acidobacteriota bacterium]